MSERVDDIELLIALVSNNPSIWDKTTEEYHSRAATTEAWRSVCQELNPKFEAMEDKEKNTYGKAVMKKWRNIRDQWMKTVKKVNSQKKSGAGATQAKYYLYHEQLSFLKKSAVHANQSSCMDDSVFKTDPCDSCSDESTNSALPKTKRKAPTPADQEGARKTSKMDLEKKILASLEGEEDAYFMFFRGIQPRMADFSEDEHLQFQCGVLNLIHNIKRNRM